MSATIHIKKVEMPRPYSSTGWIYRAFWEDGTSLFMGDENQDALVARIQADMPKAKIIRCEEG